MTRSRADAFSIRTGQIVGVGKPEQPSFGACVSVAHARNVAGLRIDIDPVASGSSRRLSEREAAYGRDARPNRDHALETRE